MIYTIQEIEQAAELMNMHPGTAGKLIESLKELTKGGLIENLARLQDIEDRIHIHVNEIIKKD